MSKTQLQISQVAEKLGIEEPRQGADVERLGALVVTLADRIVEMEEKYKPFFDEHATDENVSR